MAKTKNLTTKAALLHRNMEEESKREMQSELISWSDEMRQKEKERILRQNYSWALHGYKY